MDKQTWLGKLLTHRIFLFLLITRVVLWAVSYSPDIHWDENGYTYVAEHGYVTVGDQANYIVFPPLYPLTIRVANIIFNDYAFTGKLLATMYFIAGGFVFYKLLLLGYSKEIATKAIILISLFPTALFFSVAYPEGLLFLLFSLACYFARKHNFYAAGIFGGLATLTRPFGFLTFIILFLNWYKSPKKKLEEVTFLVSCFILSTGIYLLINYALWGDPFAFQTFLSTTWHKSFDFPWNGVWASWQRGLYTPEWGDYKIYTGFAEAIPSTLAWVFVGLGFWRKTKITTETALYLFASVLLFTSTGFILSAPRYLLSIPPFFVILAKIFKNNLLFFIWCGISAVVMIQFAIFFAHGQWAF